jgi:hypothetical protein
MIRSGGLNSHDNWTPALVSSFEIDIIGTTLVSSTSHNTPFFFFLHTANSTLAIPPLFKPVE